MAPTTGAVPPPPAPVVVVKKKTSPLVWILVGCLGLVVIGGVIFAAAGWFALKKGKEYVQEFADNPMKKSVEAMVALNPDLELVSSDDKAETMTIKNKKTGEVATFNWSDIQNGNFKWETEGQSYSVNANGQNGGVTVQDESGKTSATFGGGQVPSWFPQYHNATETNVLVDANQNGQQSTIWTFSTVDAVPDVLKFYEDSLKGSGWEVSTSSSNVGGAANGSVEAKQDNGAKTLNLVVTQSSGSASQAMVTYTAPGG
jgi:hypothetical protein